MAYSPTYVGFEEVPVQVPDDYSHEQKEAALEFAEASIELDLNEGEPIPDADVSPVVESAIKQKATCELVKGADDPNSAKLGDLSDDGTTKSDFAQTFCDRYDELIQKIESAGGIGEEGGPSDMSPYVYTTSDPDNI